MPPYNTEPKYDVGGVMLPRPFTTGRLGHFGLYVADIPACHAFYGDLLGFRHTDSLFAPDGGPDPIGVFLTYNSDHHAMVLIHASVGQSRSDRYDRGVTINQMSFQVGTLAEVVDANAMLLEEGAPIWRVGRDVPGSNWAVYFTDPDGHTIELFYGMEQIGWDRRSKPLPEYLEYRTFAAPELPVPSERDEVTHVEGEHPDVGFGTRWDETRPAKYDVGGVLLPRPFKIVNSGPISLYVADLDASTAFYRDRMGLAVTEEVFVDGERVVFLRTGTEHHTLTLIPQTLRAAIGHGEHTTLAAYGLQVGSYRQLRDAAEFLSDVGCTVVDMPRSLHTGIDYAFHVVDPAGHCVQLYHEMEQVGTAGRPLTAAERHTVEGEWPDRLAPVGATSPNLTFQGPLG